MAVPVKVPVTMTVWLRSRGVALHENCPATPVTATPAKVFVVLTRLADITVVLAGMPAPVTVCPAPISKFVAAKVTLGLKFVVDPVSVKTPILLNEDPVRLPNNTGVLAVLSIAAKFCPGWAKIILTPAPPTSKKPSNCHKLRSEAVKLVRVKSLIPDPTPFWSMLRTWRPLL